MRAATRKGGGRRGAALAVVVAATALLVGCTTATDGKAVGVGAPEAIAEEVRVVAERLLRVTETHESTGMTLLEGPTFATDGAMYVVDVTAPPGGPKVLRIDVDTNDVVPVYTDDSGAYTSAQFSPRDDRLYLTDMAGGAVRSIEADGSDPLTVFEGTVDGQRLNPDDLAFDEAGNMFISDFTALPGAPIDVASAGGRVVRIDAETREATVLADQLPSPNGISFTADFSGLWVSQYAANRIDLMTLADDGRSVVGTHPGMFVDGGTTQIDSNAVDAKGNVYQAFHNRPGLVVFAANGERLATIDVPADEAAGLSSATNVAITPGGTDAYLVVSGESGGFVYEFEALGEGTRQSNGG